MRQMTSAVRLLVTSLSSSLFTPECIAPEMHESIDVHLFRCINGMGTICILTGSTATPTLHDNQEFIAENYKSRRFPTRQCVYACVNIISEKERFAFRPWALFCSVFVSSLSSLFFACYFFAFLCFSLFCSLFLFSSLVTSLIFSVFFSVLSSLVAIVFPLSPLVASLLFQYCKQVCMQQKNSRN